MKHTLRVWEVSRKKIPIDVEFPVYRKHDLLLDEGNSIIYFRWDDDETEWKVQLAERGGEVTWEIGKSKRYFNSNSDYADYVLGRGEFACTADEFNAAVSQAALFCGEIFNTC